MDRIKQNISFRRILVLMGFIALSLVACNEYIWDDVDCSECYTPKPNDGEVKITLTFNTENTSIPIKIFKGKFEEGYIKDYSSAVVVDTALHSPYSIYLDVDEYYSVAAEYKRNGEKVTVVNGDKLKVYKVSDQCDDVCWIIRGGSINATLKK